jgi:PhnB protein
MIRTGSVGTTLERGTIDAGKPVSALCECVSPGFWRGPKANAILVAMSNQGAHPTVSVMLIVSDADAAVRWYTTALGAGQLWDLGGVAGLHLEGAPFFVHEAVPGKKQESSPTGAGLTTSRIEVFIESPDALIEQAAQAGATDVEPATEHDAPWGLHRQGGFTDPFGHRWSVGDQTPLERLPK